MTLVAFPMGATAQVALPPVTPCQGPAAAVRATADSTLPAAAGSLDTARSRARGAPDVLLIASFSADEIRFRTQPRASIRLCWGGDTLRIVERRNLPDPVVPGVTYRNVYVAMELLTHLDGVCIADRITGTGPASAKPDCSALLVSGGAKAESTRPPP